MPRTERGVPADYQHLVESALPVVRAIARRTATRPGGVERFEEEDLYQVGCEALLRAVRRYDGDRGSQFITYATHRVQGSMIDYIRNQRWGKRRVDHSTPFGRAPLSLETPTGAARPSADGGHTQQSLEETLEARTVDLLAGFEREELARRLDELPDRLQFIVRQVAAGRHQRQIAEALGCCESRVSQLLTRARAMLREEPTTMELTRRELQVLSYAAGGLTAEQTAKVMGIGYETVRSHRARARRKLHATSLTQAVAEAIRSELICTPAVAA